jgi:hypothetical protein
VVFRSPDLFFCRTVLQIFLRCITAIHSRPSWRRSTWKVHAGPRTDHAEYPLLFQRHTCCLSLTYGVDRGPIYALPLLLLPSHPHKKQNPLLSSGPSGMATKTCQVPAPAMPAAAVRATSAVNSRVPAPTLPPPPRRGQIKEKIMKDVVAAALVKNNGRGGVRPVPADADDR